MANATLLRETMSEIRANAGAWSQRHFISGDYRPARRIEDCGTTQCIASFRCLMDGLMPTRRSYCDTEFVNPADGSVVCADRYAGARFGLTCAEEGALFWYFTDNLDKLEKRVEEIISGKWKEYTEFPPPRNDIPLDRRTET